MAVTGVVGHCCVVISTLVGTEVTLLWPDPTGEVLLFVPVSKTADSTPNADIVPSEPKTFVSTFCPLGNSTDTLIVF